jgi:hypothetical protein
VVNVEPPKFCSEESVAELIRSWMLTDKWVKPEAEGGYSDGTKDHWRCTLGHVMQPDMLGGYDVSTQLTNDNVKRYFQVIADQPGKAKSAKTALNLIQAWAMDNGWVTVPFMTSIKAPGGGGGHIPWSDDHIALALAQVDPDLAKALILFDHTGQRGSDVVRLGPRNIVSYDGIEGIELRQKKTGNDVWLPISPELKAAMRDWADTETFLTTPPGPGRKRENAHGSYTRGAMSHLWKRSRDGIDALSPLRLAPDPLPPGDRKRYLQLKEGQTMGNDLGLVLHGLRGRFCVKLRRIGASEGDIAKWVGMSVPMVMRYVKNSDVQADVAAAARRLGYVTQAPPSVLPMMLNKSAA